MVKFSEIELPKNFFDYLKHFYLKISVKSTVWTKIIVDFIEAANKY